MYVPEMDGDLRITSFMNFSNEEGYAVDYDLPLALLNKIMTVGEPAPLPFWVDGRCCFVAGDAEAEDLSKEFGVSVKKHPVLIDMRQLLSDARAGLFRRQQEAWAARDIENSFSDVFHEPPVHSRYWISRFKASVIHARSLTRPPHPIDIEVRRVGLEWVERFATKTDLGRLMIVIGSLIEGALTVDRVRAILFAFFTHKLTTKRFFEIEDDLIKDKLFKRIFPHGLFQFWREHDFPRVSFRYDRPRNLFEPLYEELRKAEKNENFRRSERMAYLYFGSANSPPEIDRVIAPIFNKYSDEFYRTRHRGLRPIKERIVFPNYEAKELVFIYKTMMRLDGIMNGNARLSRVIVDRRFGIDSYFIKQMINISEGKDGFDDT